MGDQVELMAARYGYLALGFDLNGAVSDDEHHAELEDPLQVLNTDLEVLVAQVERVRVAAVSIAFVTDHPVLWHLPDTRARPRRSP